MPIQILSNNVSLTDVQIGDSYPILISGTVYGQDQIVSSQLVIKQNTSDADGAALVSVTVTATQTTHGQILVDGSGVGGAYQVQHNLLPADTIKLAQASGGSFTGWWEVRFTCTDGAEYTPVCEQVLIANPRLIKTA